MASPPLRFGIITNALTCRAPSFEAGENRLLHNTYSSGCHQVLAYKELARALRARAHGRHHSAALSARHIGHGVQSDAQPECCRPLCLRMKPCCVVASEGDLVIPRLVLVRWLPRHARRFRKSSRCRPFRQFAKIGCRDLRDCIHGRGSGFGCVQIAVLLHAGRRQASSPQRCD
jgi:hypothetical protein